MFVGSGLFLFIAVYYSIVKSFKILYFTIHKLLDYLWILVMMNNDVLILLTRIFLYICVHFYIFGSGVVRILEYGCPQLSPKLFTRRGFAKQLRHALALMSWDLPPTPTPQRPSSS